jgi:hypothetical protein
MFSHLDVENICSSVQVASPSDKASTASQRAQVQQGPASQPEA